MIWNQPSVFKRTLLAAICIITASRLAQADAGVAKATITDFATSLQLPPANLYLYGMVTGGAAPSSGFATGQYAQATDAAGYVSAALAYGTNSQNSYSTSTAYQVIGGVAVSGTWSSFLTFSGSNTSSGATSASVQFTINGTSLVVFFGLASSQQSISLGGIPGLQVDAAESGTSANLGIILAHAVLGPGTYTVNEQSAALAAGQDPSNMADLIGVYAFGSNSSASTAPTIAAGGIVNGASSTAGPLAPGSIATVYGNFLLGSPATAPGVSWPPTLDGLSMLFNGNVAAPLYYASAGQAIMQVPWELSGQAAASVTAMTAGQTSQPQAVELAPFAPGIFSMNGQGTGQGAIIDSSYKLVDSTNPATAGSTYIEVYATGLGAVTNPPATGAPAAANPLSFTTSTPVVKIGGALAHVAFSGLAPGAVGLYQVNAQVPSSVSPGSAVPVTISIGGMVSNTVTMAVASSSNAPTYTVTFTESGLSNVGSSWSVTLNGTIQTSLIPAGTQGVIVFHAPNGVYSYTVNGGPGACPSNLSGTVDVSDGNVTKTINFTSPTFFLPVTSGGKNYSVGFYGDADKYAALTSSLNSSQALFGQAAYILNSVLDPTDFPMSAVEVQDDSGAAIAPSAQLITTTLLWAYSYVNQSELAEPCGLLTQAYQGRSLQSLGIDLVTGLQLANEVLTIANLAADVDNFVSALTSIGVLAPDAEAVGSAFSLTWDILQGVLSQDPRVNAPAVVSELENLGLISSSSGNNYTATEFLTNLASTSQSQLGLIATDLYSSAYGVPLPVNASTYVQSFLQQFIPNAQQSLMASALEGGYTFLQAYGAAQFPVGDAVYAAGSSFAEGAVSGLVNAAAGAIIQGYLLPLKNLLQAESSVEVAANTVCTGGTATFAPTQSGRASIDNGGAYAATSGFVYSLLASWFAFDAQLNQGMQAGAYVYSEFLTFLAPALAQEFQLSAQQEAANQWFDSTSVPVAQSWVIGIGAFFRAAISKANSLAAGGSCGAPAVAQAALSSTNLIFGNQLVGTKSASQTITLTNTGTAPLAITGMPLGGTNAGDFAVTSTCATNLAPMANCNISVTFMPSATGTRTAGININDNAPSSPQNIALTGKGTSSNPQPSITTLSPASIPVGTATLTLTINGTGFINSSTVSFNGSQRTTTFVNSGQLTITLSVSDLTVAGTFPVTVTNPSPGGGTSNTVNFAVTAATGTVTYRVVHSFSQAEGTGLGQIIQGTDGNFYGIAKYGGPTSNPNCQLIGLGLNLGCGNIFKMDSSGNVTVLHTFTGADGAGPGWLTQGSDGAFYGTTQYGGAISDPACNVQVPSMLIGCGTVFKMDSSGNFSTLVSFSGDGIRFPSGALLEVSDGYFLGSTSSGGTGGCLSASGAGCGAVYAVDTGGNISIVHSFSGADGGEPGSLMQASDGNLYGAALIFGPAYGAVFKIDQSGDLSLLHSFQNTDGAGPQSPLFQAADGKLCGATYFGGQGFGTVFSVDLLGNFTSLHSFSGQDGGGPMNLIQASNGLFYGATQFGAIGYSGSTNPGYGTVYQIDSSGNLTTIHAFAGTPADGSAPAYGLIQAADGSLYGTTSTTVYQLRLP